MVSNVRLLVDRISYLQESIPEDVTSLSENELPDLVARFAMPYNSIQLTTYTDLVGCRYINRSVPEIEQLQSERRKGRPPSKREEALLQRTEAENKEFKTGFWMPDLTEEDVVSALKRWNGNWSGLSPLKFVRLTKEGGKQASTFPPKGLS